MPTKTDYILIGIGALGAVILTSYVPSLMKVLSAGEIPFPEDYATCLECKEKPNTYPPNMYNYMGSVDNISGIDHYSLRLLRQNGLM